MPGRHSHEWPRKYKPLVTESHVIRDLPAQDCRFPHRRPLSLDRHKTGSRGPKLSMPDRSGSSLPSLLQKDAEEMISRSVTVSVKFYKAGASIHSSKAAAGGRLA